MLIDDDQTVQKPLFTGLDCLPGQLDLFPEHPDADADTIVYADGIRDESEPKSAF
jgi:hypothetical protein